MVRDLTVTNCRIQNNKMTFFHKWQDRDCPHEERNFYITFSSVAQSCPTLCNPMDCSMPGFSVHHQLPELAHTRVHRVGDAIQPSHPLSSPSPPALNLPQHQGLFQWVSSSHQVAKVLEFQLQHQSFQWWIFRIDWFDRLAVQVKSLLQHCSSKASVLQCTKESAYNVGAAGNMGSIPGLRRSPAEGNGNPLQYSCLKNPMDRGVYIT